MNILEMHSIHKSFVGVPVLKGVDLVIRQGEVHALLGENGAGKSTALRAISGLTSVKSGSITFMGQDITGMDAQKVVSMGLIMVPEGRRVFDNLTVLENLKIGAYLRKDKAGIARDIEFVYSLFPRLKERSWQMAGTLSGGEQQMLAVGRALMAQPKLLMMDEPSLGLAPLVVKGIFEIINRLSREQHTTILLIEQNASAALKAADYGYVIETGLITMEGRGQDLLSDPRVQEAYLGKSKHAG